MGLETLSHLLRITQKPRGEVRLRSPGLCGSVFSHFQSLYATRTTGLQYYSLKEQHCGGKRNLMLVQKSLNHSFQLPSKDPTRLGTHYCPFTAGNIHLFTFFCTLERNSLQPNIGRIRNYEQDRTCKQKTELTSQSLYFSFPYSFPEARNKHTWIYLEYN